MQTRLYFEAHITVRPPNTKRITWNNFRKLAELGQWKASRFDIDEVDHYDGCWFLSARDTNYESLMGRMKTQARLRSEEGFEFVRAKIEDTLFDTKHGDEL